MNKIIDFEKLEVAIKVIKNKPANEKITATCQRVINTLTDIENYTAIMSDTILKWDKKIEDNDFTKNHAELPPIILDYIDKKIEDRELTNAKDIIALFETGELKKILKADNTFDQKALAKLKKSLTKKQGKILTVDDDIF